MTYAFTEFSKVQKPCHILFALCLDHNLVVWFFFLSSSWIPVDFLFLCWEKKHMFSSPYYENLPEFDFSISSQCNLFYCTFKKIEFSVHYILVLIWKDYFKDYFKAVILGFHCIAFQFRCSSFVIHMFCFPVFSLYEKHLIEVHYLSLTRRKISWFVLTYLIVILTGYWLLSLK